jgi:hypothetical protein
MTKIGILLCCLIFVTGCQVTSGQLRSKAVACEYIDSINDFRGSKPQWNVFGDVTAIKYCRAPRQTQHRFTLKSGYGSSQISNSDVVVFHEITERVFREMMSNNSEFRSLAQSIQVKEISNDGRPTIYALKRGYKYPIAYFVMNDGFPASVSIAWSQVHVGQVKAPSQMSLSEFEAWFLENIRSFKYTGGDYASAFTNEAKKARTQATGQSGPAGSKDLSVFGRWQGISDNFTGHMTSSTATRTGSIVLSLPDQKDRCFGTWKTTSGDFSTQQKPKGIWSVDCESKLKASGEFSAQEPWHGLGEGQDSKARSITFSYKPAS